MPCATSFQFAECWLTNELSILLMSAISARYDHGLRSATVATKRHLSRDRGLIVDQLVRYYTYMFAHRARLLRTSF